MLIGRSRRERAERQRSHLVVIGGLVAGSMAIEGGAGIVWGLGTVRKEIPEVHGLVDLSEGRTHRVNDPRDRALRCVREVEEHMDGHGPADGLPYMPWGVHPSRPAVIT